IRDCTPSSKAGGLAPARLKGRAGRANGAAPASQGKAGGTTPEDGTRGRNGIPQGERGAQAKQRQKAEHASGTPPRQRNTRARRHPKKEPPARTKSAASKGYTRTATRQPRRS